MDRTEERAAIEAAERVRTLAEGYGRMYDEMSAEEMVDSLRRDMHRAREGMGEGFAITYAILTLMRNATDGETRQRLNEMGRRMSAAMFEVLREVEVIQGGVSEDRL